MFFIKMLLILLPLLAFLWWRMWPGMPLSWRRWSGLPFILLFLLPLFYRILPDNWYWINNPIFLLSAFWLVFLGNWLLTAVPVELGLRIWCLIGKKTAAKIAPVIYRPLLHIVLLISLLFTVVGYFRSLDFVVERHVVVVPKKMERPLQLAGISDIHFDHAFSRKKLLRLKDTLDVLQPDLILHLGDFSDISTQELDRRRLGEPLQQMQATLGVLGITGNHEAYMERRAGGTLAWQQSVGINLLRDSSICLPSLDQAKICVSGREDKQFSSFANVARTPLAEFAPPREVVQVVPWVVLDHKPLSLDSLDMPDGLPRPDLGISGHTHAGQFFPWNVVIHWVWPLAQGAGSLAGVPWIVSAGFGQWGPPVRVGSTPDILLVEIRGEP